MVNAIVQNGGQTCSAGSRVLVQRSVFDQFVTQLAERISKLRVGSAEMDLDCGPLISAGQRDRVLNFIKQAKADGVPVLAEATLASEFRQMATMCRRYSSDLCRPRTCWPAMKCSDRFSR